MTRTFDQFRIDETFTTPGRTVTEGLVDQFAGVTGDFNPLHTDHEAARAGLFGAPVAHGLLVLSIVVGLWMRTGAFEGIAFSGIDGLRFLRPVRFGDTIHAEVVVKDLVDKQRYGLVVAHNEVRNQAGETVLVFDARLAAPKA